MARTYTTVAGDMWDGVAYAQLGSAEYADRLMAANPRYLGYYIFPAGIELTLPELPEQTVRPLPPWKGAAG